VQAADAVAAVVGAASGQADRTARRSGPQYGRERRMDNSPVPPICVVVDSMPIKTLTAQIFGHSARLATVTRSGASHRCGRSYLHAADDQ
jgi:hypothetical protein